MRLIFLWLVLAIAQGFLHPIRTVAPSIPISFQLPLRTNYHVRIHQRQRKLFASSSGIVDVPVQSNTAGSEIRAGDTVLVVGATSGIGQLVTQKLIQHGIVVKATCRNRVKGEELLFQPRHNNNTQFLQILELDLVSDSFTHDLEQILLNTDTNIKAVVISVGTTAFPTLKWRGGNTPQAIDQVAVEQLASVLAQSNTIQKVVLVTSVGVDRTSEIPFVFLNAFGVLDSKRAGEDAIRQAASAQDKGNFLYCIVRPGRLVGGPFTNLDVAKLLQIQGGAENGVDTAPGDALLGDCKRDACAECIVQWLCSAEANSNAEFSIISNNDKPALTAEKWAKIFTSLQQSNHCKV